MKPKVNEHERFMREALTEAARGQGATHPNPAVGAVIVKGGKIIARGWHRKAGTPHAEAVALKAAGAKAKGATLYSTLEPCDHHGRTPPCTQAILDAGIAQVVYASSDPNPLVDGKGVRRMRRAGVAVTGGVLAVEADELNRPFLKFMRQGLPWVTLKAGATLDGKLATSTGASKWITSGPSREQVHLLRSRVDAIVVGAGTVLADDPLLTARPARGAGRDPVRVIIDPLLRASPKAQVFTTAAQVRTIVACGERAPARKVAALDRLGVEVWRVAADAHGLSLRALLTALAGEGLLHVLVEGGADTHGRFLTAGLVDEVLLYLAPKLFGHGGLTWSGALDVRAPEEALRLDGVTVERVGDDLLVRGRPVLPTR